MAERNPENPLRRVFQEAVQKAVAEEAPGRALEDVEDYLAGLLVSFARTDQVFALKDAEGRRITSVYEMLAEGDVRLNAMSFEREREVHKHIGDYILFWSGFNPSFLTRLRSESWLDLRCDYMEQGKKSYWLVSRFDHRPFDQEAPTFRKMSEAYECLASALRRVRGRLPFNYA